jgi:hypothetical protein
MKNLILIWFLTLSSIHIIFGQTENPFIKGYFLPGGSLSFDFGQIKEYEPISGTNPQQITNTCSKTLETDLYFGYFIANQFAIGLKTDILVTHDKISFNLIPDKLKHTNDRIFLGPLFRYYTEFGMFFEVSTAIGFNYYGYQSINKWKEYLFETGIGYSMFISKLIAIEPQIKYKYVYSPDYEFEDYKKIINGLNLAIGLQFYLNLQENQNK